MAPSVYGGVMRQRGGSAIGNIFNILQRHLIPKIKQHAPKLIKTGVGLVSDYSRKKNMKQAVTARSKRLIGDVIKGELRLVNGQSAPKQSRVRSSKPKAKKKNANSGRRAVSRPRKKDIFD